MKRQTCIRRNGGVRGGVFGGTSALGDAQYLPYIIFKSAPCTFLGMVRFD